MLTKSEAMFMQEMYIKNEQFSKELYQKIINLDFEYVQKMFQKLNNENNYLIFVLTTDL